MITEEHLRHWMSEINYQTISILQEVDREKVKMTGINVGKNGEAFVSFEYLHEKADTIQGLLRCINDDIKNDESISLPTHVQDGDRYRGEDGKIRVFKNGKWINEFD